MRALPTSVGSIPAVLLAVTVVTTADAEAQNPAAFTNDIRPIMERSCWDCHGERIRRSGLDLRTREAALRGGSLGAAIVPGRAEESLLYRMVAGLEDPIMPRDGDPLSVAEIAAVRAWIDDGAHWDDGPTAFVDNPSDGLEESGLPPGAGSAWRKFGPSMRRPCRSWAGGPRAPGGTAARARCSASAFAPPARD